MPDHLHLLVEGVTPASDLRAFVDSAKQASAYRYSQSCRRRLWQAGYYDRVLRTAEDTLTVCRYIWSNPVRAKLVESAADYPFSGSDAFLFPECLVDTMHRGDAVTRCGNAMRQPRA